MRLAVPVGGEAVGGEGLGGGELHGDFADAVVVVEVVLAAVADNVPVAAVNHTCGVDIAEAVVVVAAAGVDETLAYGLPPIGVFVQPLARGEAVPGVVHHLAAAVEVGAETEIVVVDIVYHSLVFNLEGVERWSAEGVGVVAVEVDGVGVIAPGASHGVVAAVVGAVGVGEGVDVDVDVVEEVSDVGRGAVAAEERVAEAEHEVEAGHFVAVHGGGVEELRFVDNVGIGAVECQAEDEAALHRGADSVEVAELGMVLGELLHHFDIDGVGGIAVPGGHLVKGGGHDHGFGSEGVGKWGECVGARFLCLG